MTDPVSFGAWLRRERERREITLRAIADRTKIGVGLLEGLERGDVSRWPGGIYRRSFIRAYSEQVGLDADLVLADFERLFPPPDGEADRARAVPLRVLAPTGEEPELRLQLADTPVGPTVAALKAAGVFVGFVAAFGLAGLAGAGWLGFWCAAAVAAVVHHVRDVLAPLMRATRRQAHGEHPAASRPPATVVSFSEEQSRATSRRARAKKVAAALSALAAPAASLQRRRAARS